MVLVGANMIKPGSLDGDAGLLLGSVHDALVFGAGRSDCHAVGAGHEQVDETLTGLAAAVGRDGDFHVASAAAAR